MQIRLSLRRVDSTLVYGIPIWYRAVAWLIVCVLVAASAFSGGIGAVGVVFTALAVLAALYQERWTFDPASGSCSGRIGLLFAAKGPAFLATDIESLRIDLFAKGRLDQGSLPPEDKMPLGSQARLVIELKDGNAIMLDSVPVKRRPELELTARTLAEALGVRLE
jgi:hypothetical protein